MNKKLLLTAALIAAPSLCLAQGSGATSGNTTGSGAMGAAGQYSSPSGQYSSPSPQDQRSRGRLGQGEVQQQQGQQGRPGTTGTSDYGSEPGTDTEPGSDMGKGGGMQGGTGQGTGQSGWGSGSGTTGGGSGSR